MISNSVVMYETKVVSKVCPQTFYEVGKLNHLGKGRLFSAAGLAQGSEA